MAYVSLIYMPLSKPLPIRHIAFREYLIAHPAIRETYYELKEKLIKLDWVDGNDYNKEKDKLVKHQEQLALNWYKEKK